MLPAALLLLLMPASGPGATERDPFRLKPGAKGKVCLTCHSDFEEILKRPSVHTPVRAGDCSDCHDPHAADHGKLLARSPEEICATCHPDVVPAGSKSVHPVAGDGGCVKCHDPHASEHRDLLLKDEKDLCAGCHATLAQAVAQAKFRHSPATAGCLRCHDPHASKASTSLLEKEVPALCVSCHAADTPAFTKAHRGYRVGASDCGSCHDPHGSSTPGLLWANAHAPVSEGTCESCHLGPGAAAPLSTKREGLDLCRGCHTAVVNEALSRSRIHWPVVDRQACLHCHSPHAARSPGLLSSPLGEMCGGCHRDVIARHERSLGKHVPIEDGQCTACHAPHASDRVALLAGPEAEVCGTCHDWSKHSAHPMGEKVLDPRNRNLDVGCSSCHRSHGTAFKGLAHFDPKMDLCVECHESLKR